MAAFVVKIFQLVIRTASKPLASRFQAYILDHETLRPKVLKFAQGIHALDFTITRLAEGKPILGNSRKFLGALDDERALDLAGKFVSEGFVLAVGVGVIYWDYQRNAQKDAVKAERDKAYKASIEERFLKNEEFMKDSYAREEAILEAVRHRQDALESLLKGLEQDRRDRENQKAWWRVI